MLIILTTILAVISICSARTAFPDLTDDNFENDCLVAHNTYRAKHNAPALKVNQSIIDYAKTRCNTVSQQEQLNAGHTGLASGYGENLYWSGSSANVVSAGSVGIKAWYDEISKYNYSNTGFSSATGHFTQLIWKATTSVGCARCGGKGSQWYETYLVCDYQPPGNVIGHFPENVLPLTS